MSDLLIFNFFLILKCFKIHIIKKNFGIIFFYFENFHSKAHRGIDFEPLVTEEKYA